MTLVIFVLTDTNADNDLFQFWYLMYIANFQLFLEFSNQLAIVQRFESRLS